MFTAGIGKTQMVYCGHYSLGDMRIRLSISEINTRFVSLQDLQTLTSESGNKYKFCFTLTLDGGECSASSLRMSSPYEESMVLVRYVARLAAGHVQAFCKSYRKLGPAENRTTNPPNSGT